MASLPFISARQESESHAFHLKEATGPGPDGIHERESVVSRCGAATDTVSRWCPLMPRVQSTEELLPSNVLHCNGSSIRKLSSKIRHDNEHVATTPTYP
jgi:hypothetical protein